MDMESVSSQFLSRFSFDRSSESTGQSSRPQAPDDDHHHGHRTEHTRRHDAEKAIEQRKHGDLQRMPRHHAEHEGGVSTLTYRRSERTSLMIETQEGDRVRLKIKSSEALSMAVEQHDDSDDGHSVNQMELQARSRIRITFRVKGDLNEAELAAIQSVIGQTSELASDFFAGDVEGAFATASALEIDAEQLANIRIRMRSSEQMNYSGPISRLTPVATHPKPAEQPVENDAAPASAPPGTATEKPAATATNNDNAAAAPVVAEVEAPASQAAEGETPVAIDEVPDRNQIMAHALQSIGMFLNKLLDTFGGDDTGSGLRTPADDMTLKLQVFRSLLISISEAEADPEKEPVTALAIDTIDAVSAQLAPLDEVA